MMKTPKMSRTAWCLAGAGMLLASTALSQSLYKVIGPDGKVTYTDRPPPAASGNAQQQLMIPPSGRPGPTSAPMPGAPITQGGLIAPQPPAYGEIRASLQGTKEMNDSRDCARTNAATLSLIKATEEVMQSVNNLRIPGAKSASAYQNELLERQWKYYKSLGGAAASPEQVTLPEDPCKNAKEALRQKTVAMEAEYRKCTDSHSSEIKLASLSNQLVENQKWLAMAEALQAEKRRNPEKFAAETKSSGEWAKLYSMEPAQLRVGMESTFQEYKKYGGPAMRIEEVKLIPNPCKKEMEETYPGAPSRGSPVTSTRTQAAPGLPPGQ